MSPRFALVDGGHSRCISISDIALPCPGVALRLDTVIDRRPGAYRMPPITIDFVKSLPAPAGGGPTPSQLAGRFECDSRDFVLFSQLRRVAEMVAAAGLPPECAPSVNDFVCMSARSATNSFFRAVAISVEACATGSLAAAEAEGKAGDEEVPEGAATGDCAICYAEYVVGGATSATPPCGHTFHRRCLDRWTSVRQSCPYCRAPVPVVYDCRLSGEEEEEDGDTEDYGGEDPNAAYDAVSGSHQPS